MPGLIGTGTAQLQGAIQGLGKAADLDEQRKMMQRQEEAAARQANLQMGVGAGMSAAMIIAMCLMP